MSNNKEIDLSEYDPERNGFDDSITTQGDDKNTITGTPLDDHVTLEFAPNAAGTVHIDGGLGNDTVTFKVPEGAKGLYEDRSNAAGLARFTLPSGKEVSVSLEGVEKVSFTDATPVGSGIPRGANSTKQAALER